MGMSPCHDKSDFISSLYCKCISFKCNLIKKEFYALLHRHDVHMLQTVKCLRMLACGKLFKSVLFMSHMAYMAQSVCPKVCKVCEKSSAAKRKSLLQVTKAGPQKADQVIWPRSRHRGPKLVRTNWLFKRKNVVHTRCTLSEVWQKERVKALVREAGHGRGEQGLWTLQVRCSVEWWKQGFRKGAATLHSNQTRHFSQRKQNCTLTCFLRTNEHNQHPKVWNHPSH